MKTLLSLLILAITAASMPALATVSAAIPTDSRIKTLVYNANDVFRLMTHYGYQMNIEFAKDEEIETISLGDRTGWQVTPDANRIYLRAMEDQSHTNMTVVTDKRAYQFDLHSSQPGEKSWDELVYVVRFYYPEEQEFTPPMLAPIDAPPMMGTPLMAGYPSPEAPMMMPAPMMPQQQAYAYPPAYPQQQQPPYYPYPPQQQLAQPTFQQPPMMAYPPQMAMPQPQAPMMSPSPMGYGASGSYGNSGQILPLPLPSLPPLPSASMGGVMPAPEMGNTPQFHSPPSPLAGLPIQPAPQVQSMPYYPSPYDVPPVQVAPPMQPLAMTPPINPNKPFIINHLSPRAKTLARDYPSGSYDNPSRTPRTLPSLQRFLPSEGAETPANSYRSSLRLPSQAPGDYINF